MKMNFSDLLDSQRVRSLWGRSVEPETAVQKLTQILNRLPDLESPQSAAAHAAQQAETAARQAVHVATADAVREVKREVPQHVADLVDLADVPVEPPHQILDALDAALRFELGSRSAMIRPAIEALRVRVHRLDPTAPAPDYHPLRHAAGGSIPQLLSRLEDTLRGLRRVAGK